MRHGRLGTKGEYRVLWGLRPVLIPRSSVFHTVLPPLPLNCAGLSWTHGAKSCGGRCLSSMCVSVLFLAQVLVCPPLHIALDCDPLHSFATCQWLYMPFTEFPGLLKGLCEAQWSTEAQLYLHTPAAKSLSVKLQHKFHLTNSVSMLIAHLYSMRHIVTLCETATSATSAVTSPDTCGP